MCAPSSKTNRARWPSGKSSCRDMTSLMRCWNKRAEPGERQTMTTKNSIQQPSLPAGEDLQPADGGVVQPGRALAKTIETLVAEAEEILASQIDPMMREALREDPEKLAEWDALMQQCAEAAAQDDREAEEAKVAAEIRGYLDR